MRLQIFEALAPVCPRCLHGGAGEAPLTVATTAETREGRLWHGILHCSNHACWAEFPVVDGVPVIVPDPAGFLRNARWQLLARDDLPEPLEGLIGDALGPGGEFDTTRQHLGIYADAHYRDWSEGADAGAELPLVTALRTGLELLGAEGEATTDGPTIDLGGGVGRAGWELSRGLGPVLVADLNLSFLRFAQRLALDGQAAFPRRRVGLVYDRTWVQVPARMDGALLDFWAVDATALPFRPGSFRLATALNLVDSITGPTEAVAEAARVLAPGGGAIFTTPHDWTQNAAEPGRWMGGHSQRAPHGGAAEPVLAATLRQHGLELSSERSGLPWRLRLHARAEMHYDLHLVACRRTGQG